MKVFYDKICNMKLIADIEKLNQNKPANLLVSALGKLVDDETIVYYNFPLYRGGFARGITSGGNHDGVLSLWHCIL